PWVPRHHHTSNTIWPGWIVSGREFRRAAEKKQPRRSGAEERATDWPIQTASQPDSGQSENFVPVRRIRPTMPGPWRAPPARPRRRPWRSGARADDQPVVREHAGPVAEAAIQWQRYLVDGRVGVGRCTATERGIGHRKEGAHAHVRQW